MNEAVGKKDVAAPAPAFAIVVHNRYTPQASPTKMSNLKKFISFPSETNINIEQQN